MQYCTYTPLLMYLSSMLSFYQINWTFKKGLDNGRKVRVNATPREFDPQSPVSGTFSVHVATFREKGWLKSTRTHP